MHVFYTPDIQKTNELPEEEAQHCKIVFLAQTVLFQSHQGDRIAAGQKLF